MIKQSAYLFKAYWISLTNLIHPKNTMFEFERFRFRTLLIILKGHPNFEVPK